LTPLNPLKFTPVPPTLDTVVPEVAAVKLTVPVEVSPAVINAPKAVLKAASVLAPQAAASEQ